MKSVLSVIGYEIEMRGIPIKYEKDINSIMWSFIWDGKPNRVSRAVCCLPKEKGGMGMVNLRNFIKSKQVKSLYNVVNSDLDKWNAIGKYWLTSLDSKFDSEYFLCTCSNINGLNRNKMSNYYENLLTSWVELQKLHGCNNTSRDELLSSNIMGNDKLKFKGKALFFGNFSKCGIKTVNDIWCEQNNTFATPLAIFNKLNDKRNWISQYSQIKAAFTPESVNLLKNDNLNVTANKLPFKIVNTKFMKEDKVMAPTDVKLKHIQHFYDFPLAPNCEYKWEQHFQTPISWELVWMSLNNNFASRKAKQLQWKLLHNIIYTEDLLKKINMSNGTCHFCNETESLLHLFVNCNFVNEVWTDIFTLINSVCTQTNIDIVHSSENVKILGNEKRDIN